MDSREIKNQDIKRDFVNREVVYCVSSMVHELAQKAEHFPEWYDDLVDAFTGLPDYEEALIENGWEQFEDEYGIKCWRDTSDDTTWAGPAEETCREFDIDAYEYAPEVYEHWVVSNFLAEKLEAHGEKIIEDILGVGPIWCRCATGQAILLDGVITEICSEMEILDGQAHSWS